MVNEAYLRGVKNGLTRFAYRRGGQQVVGENEYPLADAMRDVDLELKFETRDRTGFRHVKAKAGV